MTVTLMLALAALPACSSSAAVTGDGAIDLASDRAGDRQSDQTDGPHDRDGSSPADILLCTALQLAKNDKTAIPGQIELFSSEPPPNPVPAQWHATQYRQPCITIKAGQSLDFSGDFASYPLEPTGGDPANPIPVTATNPPAILGVRLLHVVFPSPGTFRYDCPLFPTDMFGTVRVAP